MIRNVVVGRLRPGADRGALEAALAAIVALEPPGLVEVHVGLDLQLREQSWDFAITSDFVDTQAYQAYDAETRHNRIRREMFGPLCAEIARVQIPL